MEERLQKVLANAGVASRRACEKIITQGRVKVNDKTAKELGVKVDISKDHIYVDGKEIDFGSHKKVVLVFNKPKNVVSSMRDDKGRSDLSDFINEEVFGKLNHVGRLDYNSEGLLFLTNDGEFSNLIMHPRYNVQKTYEVTLDSPITKKDCEALKETGVELEDGRFKFDEIIPVAEYDDKKSLVLVKIHSGKNRIVRRMFSAMGYRVVRLLRTEVAGVKLGSTKAGKYRELSQKHIDEIKAEARKSMKVKPVKKRFAKQRRKQYSSRQYSEKHSSNRR